MNNPHTLMTVPNEIACWERRHLFMSRMKNILQYWFHIFSKYFLVIIPTYLLPIELNK